MNYPDNYRSGRRPCGARRRECFEINVCLLTRFAGQASGPARHAGVARPAAKSLGSRIGRWISAAPAAKTMSMYQTQS
jgi:hypothetical protein